MEIPRVTLCGLPSHSPDNCRCIDEIKIISIFYAEVNFFFFQW